MLLQSTEEKGRLRASFEEIGRLYFDCTEENTGKACNMASRFTSLNGEGLAKIHCCSLDQHYTFLCFYCVLCNFSTIS